MSGGGARAHAAGEPYGGYISSSARGARTPRLSGLSPSDRREDQRRSVALGERGVIADSRDALAPFSGGLCVNGVTSSIIGAYDGHLGEAELALGELDTARDRLTAAVDLLEALHTKFTAH